MLPVLHHSLPPSNIRTVFLPEIFVEDSKSVVVNDSVGDGEDETTKKAISYAKVSK
jgi:hypothetical protein